jgi:hypothetical protein
MKSTNKISYSDIIRKMRNNQERKLANKTQQQRKARIGQILSSRDTQQHNSRTETIPETRASNSMNNSTESHNKYGARHLLKIMETKQRQRLINRTKRQQQHNTRSGHILRRMDTQQHNSRTETIPETPVTNSINNSRKTKKTKKTKNINNISEYMKYYKNLLKDIKYIMIDYKVRNQLMKYIDMYFYNIIKYIIGYNNNPTHQYIKYNLEQRNMNDQSIITNGYDYSILRNNDMISRIISILKKDNRNINKPCNVSYQFCMTYAYYCYLNIFNILNKKIAECSSNNTDNNVSYNIVLAHNIELINNINKIKKYYYYKIYIIIFKVPYLLNYIFNELSSINFNSFKKLKPSDYVNIYIYIVYKIYNNIILNIKNINMKYKEDIEKLLTNEITKLDRYKKQNLTTSKTKNNSTKKRSVRAFINRTIKNMGKYMNKMDGYIKKIRQTIQKKIYLFKNKYDLIHINKKNILTTLFNKYDKQFEDTNQLLYNYDIRNININRNRNININRNRNINDDYNFMVIYKTISNIYNDDDFISKYKDKDNDSITCTIDEYHNIKNKYDTIMDHYNNYKENMKKLYFKSINYILYLIDMIAYIIEKDDVLTNIETMNENKINSINNDMVINNIKTYMMNNYDNQFIKINPYYKNILNIKTKIENIYNKCKPMNYVDV